MVDGNDDEIHELAKKMFQAKKGSSPAQPKGLKAQGKKVEGLNGSAPESDVEGATEKPQRIKTQVENDQAGPDEQLMNDIQSLVPKKKIQAPSVSEDSPPLAPRSARSKGAPKSGSEAEDSPAPEARPTSSPDRQAIRHKELLDELPDMKQRAMEGEFDPLEQDLPRGDGVAKRVYGPGPGGPEEPPNASPSPEVPIVPPRWHGPATVGAIAAQLLLGSSPNGEDSKIPGGSIEGNNESKLRQLQDTGIPSSHQEAGYKPGFNPVATEVGNTGALPKQVKRVDGLDTLLRMSQDARDRALANNYAEQLRQNFPDQIGK